MRVRKARQDGIYVIPVSFVENESDLFKYVDGKGWGFSQYVKYLIRQDMQGGTPQGVPNNMSSNTVAQDEISATKEAKTKAKPKVSVDKSAINGILELD